MLETLPRTRYAFALLAYAFAAIMVGTTSADADVRAVRGAHALRRADHDGHLRDLRGRRAVRADGLRAVVRRHRPPAGAAGGRPVFALASAVVFLAADSVPLLLVGRVLSGLSAGIFTGTATAAVIEAAPPSWHNRAAAVATAANVGGLGGGPLLAGLLVEYAPQPLHLTFIVHIGLVVLAAVAVLVVPETSDAREALGCNDFRCRQKSVPRFRLRGHRRIRWIRVTGLFTSVAPAFLSEVIGIDNHAVAGAVASAVFIASAVTQLFAGRIAPKRALVLGCAILVVGMAILAVALQLSSLCGSDRRRSSRRRRPRRQLQPRPGRRCRAHAGRPAGRNQLRVLRRCLRGDLAAGDRRRPGRPGVGTCAPPGVSFAIAVAFLAIICLVAIVVQRASAPQPTI